MTRALDPDGASAFARLWVAFGPHPKSARERRRAFTESLSAEDFLALRIEESRRDLGDVTRMFFGLAVPIWIDKMRWWRPAYREQVAHRIGEEIGACQALVADENAEGRVPASERGSVAADFNVLAQGLAILAFCPGGVVFAGHHWQASQGALPAEVE